MIISEYLSEIDSKFSVMPFWFWNDDLSKSEITRQLDDFVAHGVSGFVIHPRVGLPRSLGWMSEELLSFYDFAIESASQRGMKVILYDEGMYPSGSSCGQVVASNPDFQARCLDFKIFDKGVPVSLEVDQNIVTQSKLDDDRTFVTIDRKADGYIRGLHYIKEGLEAEDEPLAADILNPASVNRFIELVYQVFVTRFKNYIGSTIIGIFTDEPNMLGKSREKNVYPGTKGILPEINRILGYDFSPYLECLWNDQLPLAKQKRAEYIEACEKRLLETYYKPLYDFCSANGINLVGHPASSDDIGALKYFHTPGQDMVWREVLPDTASALEGGNSTQGKCSYSAMVHTKRERNLNELCGAYGHQLTWEEMNWLSKWCLVRGVNLLIPHAFYYSIRGMRKDERPPDVGPNSAWWGKYKAYADACRKLSFVNTDSIDECYVAIIGKCNWLPWKSAKVCFENQIDFNYLDENHFENDISVAESGLNIADKSYQFIVYEHEVSDEIKKSLQPLVNKSDVYHYQGDGEPFLDWLESRVEKLIQISPKAPGLRVRVVNKDGYKFYMLFNEVSKDTLVSLTFGVSGQIELLRLFDETSESFQDGSELCIKGHEYLLFVVKS